MSSNRIESGHDENPIKGGCSSPKCDKKAHFWFKWRQYDSDGFFYTHKMAACPGHKDSVEERFARLTVCMGRLGKRPRFKRASECPPFPDRAAYCQSLRDKGKVSVWQPLEQLVRLKNALKAAEPEGGYADDE